MRRVEARQGLRFVKFVEVYEGYEAKRLSHFEAAEILGMSERTFRRWRLRYESDGEAGLFDRRLGKVSPSKVPVDEIEAVLTLYRERYHGFTVKHFHEKLVSDHHFRWGYTWTKLRLQEAGLVEPARGRSKHRKKRPRRPLRGMMLHQDGSMHRWLSGLDHDLDLIVTLDDATSEIYSAFLVEEEGTASSFRGLGEVIAAHGLPCSLYTDRGSHYFFTAEAGGKVDKSRLTQVGRALHQLGIEHIAGYSPEARGRSERAFRTLQDRLIKELELAGINTIEAANQYLHDIYIPAHNKRFAIAAEQAGSAFVADREGRHVDILCVQEERTVRPDNTVSYKCLCLQIPESPLRRHFVRAKVRVHDYPDGGIKLFHGPMCIAAYDAKGALIGQNEKPDMAA